MLHLLYLILVGLVAGWLTGKIMKGGGYGFFLDIILGIAGAIVGGFIAAHLGFGGGGLIFTLIVAVLGAILIVFLFRLITGKKS
ncbi:MAG: GlsB/YeaQ/YmgE family stress response membrane protein [Terracidiphilus sp.]